MSPAPCIGVFDSGVGGLTVLRALRARLPDVDLVYVADSAHAPYGDKPDAAIIDRSSRITRFLQQQGAALIVVACNTATAAAIAGLRQAFALPFVGIEPGVKPARTLSQTGHIGVMATPSTLRSAKFKALVQAHAADATVHLQPCAGLADAIERGYVHAAELQNLVETYCAPLRAARCDVVVLGCTHYPLIAGAIGHHMGSSVRLVDTAQAVAEQAARVWSGLPHLTPDARRHRAPRAYGGGDLAVLERMARLCDLPDLEIHALPDI